MMANGQSLPAMAWDGTSFLVVWSDSRDRSSGNDLYGARVRASDGALLDPAGIAICAQPGTQNNPAVAWDGTSFLVVWQDSRTSATSGIDLYGGRVSSAGALLDGAGFPISTATGNQQAPALAWNGTHHLVVWQDDRNLATSYIDVYGARVTSAGTVTDPTGIPISTATAAQTTPVAAWDGTRFLVVWQDGRIGSGTQIYGARVSTLGTVQDASGLRITFSLNATSPAIATDGTRFLVVWQDDSGLTSNDVWGNRVRGSDGAVDTMNGFVISATPDSESYPAVGWNSTHYLVVWHDQLPSGGFELRGARLAASGAVADATGFSICESGGRPDLGVVAAGPSFGVVYSKQDPDPQVRRLRAYVRTIPGNRSPVATGADLSTPEDAAIDVTFVATDADGDPLAWTIVAGPSHGTLAGSPPAVRYTPAADYHGSDAVSFTVSDGLGPSLVATVTITVTSVDDVPVAYPQPSIVTNEDTSVGITLTATDVEDDPLTYAVVTPPAHGTLSGTAPNLTYTPSGNYFGADAFTFKANDGTADSALAPVSITVNAVNDPPAATPNAYTVTSGNSVSIILSGTDVEPGSTLTYLVVSAPAHGTLTGTPPMLVYTPTSGYSGADSLAFKANDGSLDSTAATISDHRDGRRPRGNPLGLRLQLLRERGGALPPRPRRPRISSGHAAAAPVPRSARSLSPSQRPSRRSPPGRPARPFPCPRRRPPLCPSPHHQPGPPSRSRPPDRPRSPEGRGSRSCRSRGASASSPSSPPSSPTPSSPS